MVNANNIIAKYLDLIMILSVLRQPRIIRQCRFINSSVNQRQIFKLSSPTFSKNIFTNKVLQESQDEFSDSDFFKSPNIPNPLFSMTKQDLFALDKRQYKTLVQLKIEDIQHAETFCLNLRSIIEDNLLKDHKLIAHFLDGVSIKIKELVFASLKRLYFNNKIKLSCIELLDDAGNQFTHTLINDILSSIMSTSKDQETKSKMIMSYLRNLAHLDVINPHCITVKQATYDQIVSCLPRTKLSELYSYLLNVNIKPESGILKLQQILRKGSELERFVLRTGKLDVEWHDTVAVIDKKLNKKMYYFFTFDMLKVFAFQAIKRDDLVDSNLYLDLIVSKFEEECKELEDSPFVIDNVKEIIDKKVEEILRIIMFHLITFKGVESSLDILRYMVKNNLKAKLPILLTMMSNFRQKGYLDEAILLIDNMNLDDITQPAKLKLVDEIFKLTAAKYSKEPNVVIGYALTAFQFPLNGLRPLLENLKLINESIQVANIDPRLIGTPFQHDQLYEIYKCYLASKQHVTPEMIEELFDLYCKYLPRDLKQFKDDKISDKILTLFLNFLMKPNPFSQQMNLIEIETNYEIAKKIIIKFYDTFNVNSNLIKPYPLELMIYSSLLHHHELTLATRLMKISHQYKLPFTFNQVYPFIIYYYENGDFDRAKSWYNLLVGSGIKSKSKDMKRVYRIVRELQWEVNGYNYRRHIIRKNYAKREALQTIDQDQLPFLGAKPQTQGNVALLDNLNALLPHLIK